MSDINEVYKAPKAKLDRINPDDADHALAPRGKRLFASLIDGVISIAVAVPVMFYLGFWEMTQKGQQPPFTSLLIIGTVGAVAFVLIHG